MSHRIGESERHSLTRSHLFAHKLAHWSLFEKSAEGESDRESRCNRVTISLLLLLFESPGRVFELHSDCGGTWTRSAEEKEEEAEDERTGVREK